MTTGRGTRRMFTRRLLAVGLLVLAAAGPVRAGGADDWMAEAERLWAEGAAERAMELYRRVLDERPDDAEAYDRVRRLAARTPLADDPDRLRALAREFPGGTHMLRTRHYLIVYDTSHTAASSRAKLLEAAHDAFYSRMRSAGWRPLPLRERLVCIVFARQEDYLAYARRVDGADAAHAGGYYSGRTNRIALFDSRTRSRSGAAGERAMRLRGAIRQIDREIAAAADRGQPARARLLRGRRARAVRRLHELERRHAAGAGLTNIAHTLHEAAHQLAHNSTIQSRRSVEPFWFSEGLAMSFETTEPANRFGPASDNPPRRRAFRRARRAGDTVPLRELVALGRLPAADADAQGALYALSWRLFHHLFNEQPDALRRYARSLRDNPETNPTPDAMLERFETHFGPIESIEAELR